MSNPPQETQNPFVGPRPFERSDTSLFKGRSQEARDLLTLFLSRRLVLLYSPSGAGKTSLLKAKLIPDLEQQQEFEVLPVGRVGDSIVPPENYKGNLFIFNLLASLGICDRPEVLAADHMSLNQFLLNVGYDGKAFVYFDEETADSEPALEEAEEALEIPINPRALIIDQFEEIFTTHPELEAERIAFFRQIGEAMANDPYLYILISMRGDYLFRIIPYVHLLPNSLRARFQLQRLQRAGALEAICEPAAEAGRPFDPDVAEALVACLRRVRVAGDGASDGERPLGDFVEAMQLQVVCQQLWRRLAERPGKSICMEDVAWAVGSSLQGEEKQADALELFVDNALADYYENSVAQVMAHLHNKGFEHFDEHMVRRWFSKELITEAGTRNLLARMETETKGLPETAVAYLDKHLYLIRNELRTGNSFVELVHDSFVEPIRAANRKWQENLERRIPWLSTARQYAQNPRPGLLLADYNSLQAARKRLAEEVKKGDFPPSTQKFLENFLEEGEEAYQRQLIHDIPWLNSARQYAETNNPDLLFTGKTLQLAREQADQAKAKGNLPSLVDDFLQASDKKERKQEIKRLRQQEEARRREALQELAHERSLKEQANKAAVKQRKLTRLAVFVGGIAVVMAIFAGVSFFEAQENAETAATKAAEAAMSAAVAATAQSTAEAAATEAIRQEAIAREEATKAATARAEAEAAKTQAETLRLLSQASVFLRDGEFLSAILTSLTAYPAIAANLTEDSGPAEDDIENLLRQSLFEVYLPLKEADLQQTFKASLSLPSAVTTENYLLFPGPESTLAVLSANEIEYWPVDDPSSIETLSLKHSVSFSPTLPIVNPTGTHLAFVSSDQQVQVYKLSGNGVELIESSDDINGTKLGFSQNGDRLLSVLCVSSSSNTDESSATCTLRAWNTAENLREEVNCNLRLLQEATAVTFLDEDTALISGRFNSRPILFVVPLTTSAKNCSYTLIELPDDLPTIEHLAFLPEDNLLLSAGDAAIQWWQVAYEPLLALTPIGPALAQKATIRSVVPLIGQSAFVILDSNQQLTWYNAKWDFASLSRWACETAGRDLTADEWLTINPNQTIASFDRNEYHPVCDGYNYPLHSSFAEQTLILCNGNDSWVKAEALYHDSVPGGDFLPWAVATLMVRFYEDEPSFLTNDCWGVLSDQLGEEARQQLNEAINEITAAKNVLTSDEYKDELDAITQAIGASDYPHAFSQLLERQNRAFCFDRGFIEACRQLAQFATPLQLNTSNLANTEDTQVWAFEADGVDFVAINLQAPGSRTYPSLTLYDLNGIQVAFSEGYETATLDSPLLKDGAYTLLAGWQGEPGSYALSVETVTPTMITAGTTNVIAEADQRLWRFNVSQGDLVTINLEALGSENDSFLTLYNPDGEQIGDGGGYEIAAVSALLPEDGPYTLAVRWANEPSSYTLSVETVSPTIIAAGTPNIAAEANQRLWRFNSSQGDLVTINLEALGSENDSFLTLYNSDGQQIGFGEGYEIATISALLPEDGPYTLAVRWANEPSPYTLSVETVSPTMIAAETTNVTAEADERLWRFNGSQGDSVAINLLAAEVGSIPYLYLYDENGRDIGRYSDSPGTSTAESLLPEYGTYTIEVRWSSEPSNYTLSVETVTPTLITPETASVVAEADQRLWQFKGGQNDFVTINLETSELGSYPLLTLFGPSGEQIGYGEGDEVAALTALLPEDDTYIIQVRWSGEPSSSYTLSVELVEALPALLITGDNFSQDAGAEQRWWQFVGEQGTQVVITMVALEPSGDPYLRLYDAGGSEIASNDDSDGTLNSRIEFVLPTNGLYQIEADWFANPDRYTLTFNRQ